jgi:hypothetical protein
LRDAGSVRPPLLITGGPASGKSATTLLLAKALHRVAAIDVDDIRQLVVAGHAAPWEGEEGARQQRLGVRNACDLAQNFLDARIEVIMSDVVNPDTLQLYRDRLPRLVIVRFRIPLIEARRRATLRQVHLTADEFSRLHEQEAASDLPADHIVDVDQFSLQEQCDAVMQVWSGKCDATQQQ